MPPKPKYSKDEIIEAAYALMEEQGIEAVVAREVGKRLRTTTGPIFTFFSSMDELKEAVYFKGIENVRRYFEEALEYSPAFKELGLRIIKYAKDHPKAYQMIFLSYGSKREEGVFNNDLIKILEPMKKEVMEYFDLSYEHASDIIEKMATYAQGIASFLVTSDIEFPEKWISKNLSDICVSLVAGWKIKNGNLDIIHMKAMLDNSDIIPEKKPKL